MWTRVVRLLELRLRPSNSLLLIETLSVTLQDALEDKDFLPLVVKNILGSPNIALSSVTEFAERIENFFSGSQLFDQLPVPPTACAVLLIAIESAMGQAFPPQTASSLATCLGERMGTSGQSILSRRRIMVIALSKWAILLPWVDFPIQAENKRELWTTSRMSALIRVLPDILQFQKELAHLRTAQNDVDLDLVIELSAASEKEDISPTQSPPNFDTTDAWSTFRTRPKSRGAQAAQRMISQLLDPKYDKSKLITATEDADDVQERLSRIELQVLFGSQEPLTRLQALSLQRGGESNINDEELFEPGELEGYQNPDDVARYLADSHPEWQEDSDMSIVSKLLHSKRSKAASVPQIANYLDDESSDTDMDSRSGPTRDWRRATESTGKVGSDEAFRLEKETYMAFGLLSDYDGMDPDTARYFERDMEKL
jgi:transcription factor IIIB 90 kDa subunit